MVGCHRGNVVAKGGMSISVVEVTCAECSISIWLHAEDGKLVPKTGRVAFRKYFASSDSEDSRKRFVVWLCDDHMHLVNLQFVPYADQQDAP